MMEEARQEAEDTTPPADPRRHPLGEAAVPLRGAAERREAEERDARLELLVPARRFRRRRAAGRAGRPG